MNGEHLSSRKGTRNDASVAFLGVTGEIIDSTNVENKCRLSYPSEDSVMHDYGRCKSVIKSVNGVYETSSRVPEAPSLHYCDIVYKVRNLDDGFPQMIRNSPVVHPLVDMAIDAGSERLDDGLVLFDGLG